MKQASISGNFQNFFASYPELPFVLLWGFIYSLSLHPDAPWGDGLGYAISVQQGFDLGVNANSHFGYLNFFAFIKKLTAAEDALVLLRYGSVFWACISIWMAFRIGFALSGSRLNGILCLQMLASGFACWRLACIPEVYSMELAFFSAALYCFFDWLRTGRASRFFLFALIHAVGLLVHIHLILMFVLYPLAWIQRRKEFYFPALLAYLLPFSVFFTSVEVLRINIWPQILFENQQQQLLSFGWKRLLAGPFFSTVILLYMMSGILLIPFLKKNTRITFRNPLFQAGILLFLSFFLFSSLYPDPGIFVFLLPAFLLMAIGFSLMVQDNTSAMKRLIVFMPVFQTVCYILLFLGLRSFAPQEWLETQRIKGGPGFVSLPWAKGNAASVCDITRKLPPDSIPEGLRWNADQVAVRDSLLLLNEKAVNR
jgi:hypothetical protein